MVEKILPNFYRIEIPLPGSPLKSINSYVIRNERNLIIDTGWNQDECLTAMQAGLGELGVDINQTDFFITHLHSDHLGLASTLTTETSTVYFNKPDADRMNAGIPLDDLIRFARLNGYPEKELEAIPLSHPGFKFKAKEELNFHTMKEGDLLDVGDYVFKCIETPGHTKGHMCLYEPDQKILVSGDHILQDITPTISSWSDDWNPLKEYLASLDKIYAPDIRLVLPGHRRVFGNCRERIEELKLHHRNRLEEILSILREGRKNAFWIASQMSWDVLYDSWDLFPVSQKWFAIGEAIAHLKYLEEEGIVRKEMQGQEIFFSLTGIHQKA